MELLYNRKKKRSGTHTTLLLCVSYIALSLQPFSLSAYNDKVVKLWKAKLL